MYDSLFFTHELLTVFTYMICVQLLCSGISPEKLQVKMPPKSIRKIVRTI